MQVDHVHNKEITSGGNLHFDTNTNAGSIENLAFDPVDVTRHLLGPATEPFKLLVNELSNGSATIGVRFLQDQQLKAP